MAYNAVIKGVPAAMCECCVPEQRTGVTQVVSKRVGIAHLSVDNIRSQLCNLHNVDYRRLCSTGCSS
eukprot:6202872-Pleurochrysis_carterae.AAC.3